MHIYPEQIMTYSLNNALYASGTTNECISLRLTELNNQHWDRSKSMSLAKNEGISLNDGHWNVILFLRSYYLEFGLPRFARTTARALNRHFAANGGSKYLRSLFIEGPVNQGSRLASLPIPSNALDTSFGTSY
jgi:tRNA 2-thiouridine synthesizing protein E